MIRTYWWLFFAFALVATGLFSLVGQADVVRGELGVFCLGEVAVDLRSPKRGGWFQDGEGGRGGDCVPEALAPLWSQGRPSVSARSADGKQSLAAVVLPLPEEEAMGRALRRYRGEGWRLRPGSALLRARQPLRYAEMEREHQLLQLAAAPGRQGGSVLLGIVRGEP